MSENKQIAYAFPRLPLVIKEGGTTTQSMANGMELLDYFAAAALPGLINSKKNLSEAELAEAAYHIASEMIRVREGNV
jgi:hypothetical protein